MPLGLVGTFFLTCMNILLAHMYIHMYMPGTKARKGQALELLELELLTDGCEPPSMLVLGIEPSARTASAGPGEVAQ